MKNKNLKKRFYLIASLLTLIIIFANSILAQTTAFTYQGKLNDTGNPPTAAYEMRFGLFDAVSGGTQIGATTPVLNVSVSSGIFTVQLDFGADTFDGAGRFIEIALRRTSSDSFTTLAPRQRVTSAPYAIKSLNSTAADSLSAACVGCVADANIADVAGSKVTGEIPVLSIPAGSDFYIRNSTSQQTASSFNIDGDGAAGGTLTANAVDSATQYNIGGSRVLSLGGADNLYAGVGAGLNTTSNGNSFFGTSAGFNNGLGEANSFFGRSAGFQNTSGYHNSFFGTQAGRDNSTGNNNSFFGRAAGIGNSTGADNSFFGASAGQANGAGGANSFFGVSAGLNNKGSSNSFFGRSAGFQNTTGYDNSFFGVQAGRDNSTGYNNSFFGKAAGISNTTGIYNTFVGDSAGLSNTSGSANSFIGRGAGANNTTGASNTFIGFGSGAGNTTGGENTFVGDNTGYGSTGSYNSFFGTFAGENNQAGAGNAFFGQASGYNPGYGPSVNGTGSHNTFFGASSGYGVGSGQGNVAIGTGSGTHSDSGSNNTSLGRTAGRLDFANGNNLRNNNTFIGYNANGGGSVNNSTAIGVNAFAANSNSIVLGTTSETVRIPGNLVVTGTVSKGGGSFRIDHPLDPENKYLYHSFVESPDMMNVYNGNITTDAMGEAIVTLPAYFDALNRDFRYQLTVIGKFAQAIVGEKIKGNSFVIRTDKPNVEVSWQVTGIRKDKFANENRIQPEVEKTAQERGKEKPQQEK